MAKACGPWKVRQFSVAIASSKVYRFPVEKLESFLPHIQDAFLVKALYDLRNAQRQLIVMAV